jgi:hypothetical protein
LVFHAFDFIAMNATVRSRVGSPPTQRPDRIHKLLLPMPVQFDESPASTLNHTHIHRRCTRQRNPVVVAFASSTITLPDVEPVFGMLV